MTDIEKAEDLLTNGPQSEWYVRKSTAHSLLSIAKALESLESMAREWTEAHRYPAIFKQVADQLDTPG